MQALLEAADAAEAARFRKPANARRGAAVLGSVEQRSRLDAEHCVHVRVAHAVRGRHRRLTVLIGLASIGLAATMDPMQVHLDLSTVEPGLDAYIHVPYIVIAGVALVLDAKDVLAAIFNVVCAFGVTSPRYYISGIDNTLTIDRFPQPEVISLEDVRRKMMPRRTSSTSPSSTCWRRCRSPASRCSRGRTSSRASRCPTSRYSRPLWDLRGCSRSGYS